MKKSAALLPVLLLMLLLSGCAYAEEPEPDYLEMMVTAAANGDLEGGYMAERARNKSIDKQHSDEIKICFDELLLLSKLIYSEAGGDWLRDEQRFCVGEVALNRVASPEFPDTLEEVVYQEGQYETVMTAYFQQDLLPSRSCVRIALRLLQGERMMEPQVVYGSGAPMGPIYAHYYTDRSGDFFFCESNHPELYALPVNADAP